MNCSTGDSVTFKLESGEINEGDVERGIHENMVYIKSYYGSAVRAYRIPEKKIISRLPGRTNASKNRGTE